ncbi:hypothetical protein [Clavibacter sp. MX14-G9D]|uniref:hypothetical protein n=1 Tax=Clavibacter sp. MX14-G9D TaxID=3064656 RepID=UPI00293EEC58|nr:hypothetical protein [Clavibacter sp. MX14-G9D]
MSAVPATGTSPTAVSGLAMLGSADAAACEGDACLVPTAPPSASGTASAVAASDAVAPGTAAPDDGSPAADLARVRDAIDAGRAI